ncbi:MAG: methylamine utilization protein MauJ [Candidatus Binatia bacterium]
MDFLSQERVKELQRVHQDIGHYLYDSGRSALAHAFQPPLIDPDLFDDTYRINLDLPVLEELVKLYMERELGLPVY